VELIAKSADLLVNADENKLIRVLQNLASNAIEAFNGSGGKIEIAIAANGAWAEIQLTDNGPGIPEAIRTRLFEAFVTYGKQSGTGLGTAIAKSIIDAHGGTIDFQSQLGEGTKFYIRLPLLNFDC
jgi:signal transduction histidine kinase